MNKRGLIVIGIGVLLISVSFGIAFTIFPDSDPTVNSELFVPNLLEGMFDQVSDQSVIFPGGSDVFSYSGQSSGVPLMWGVQIMDFEEGDAIRVGVYDVYGDDVGSAQADEPVIFDMFVMENSGSYDFEIENTGSRPITVLMMFVEDPENSDLLSNPDSPLVSIVMPLAISGIVLLAGVVVMIVGVILCAMDWKKEKNRSRYY